MRFVMLALPLAPRTVPKSPDRGHTAAHRAPPYTPSPPNSHFESLKRGAGAFELCPAAARVHSDGNRLWTPAPAPASSGRGVRRTGPGRGRTGRGLTRLGTDAGSHDARGFHMTRYYGVFASHHRPRERVIPRPPHRRRRDSSRWTSPSPATRPNPRPRPRPDHDASAGQSSSPASSGSTSPAAEDVAVACVSSRSSPMPTPSPESSTAPALPLRLLLLARSCCSPDRAPLRRRVHPPAPRCRPHCPSRAPDRALRHERASPRAQDRAKIPDHALPAARRAAPYSPSRPNSYFKTLSARRRERDGRRDSSPKTIRIASFVMTRVTAV